MEPLFFELIAVLEQQKETLQGMTVAANEQKLALRDIDMPGLNKVVGQLNILSGKMKKLDLQRENLQIKLEEKLDLPAGATLTQLGEKITGEAQEKLADLQRELKTAFEGLKRINEINNILTGRALAVNRTVLKILHPESSSTYQASGKMHHFGANLSGLNKSV